MFDLNNIVVVDDAISPQYQDMIENWLLAPASTWSFARDVALADNVIAKLNLHTRPGFSKTLFNIKTNYSNDLYPMILPMVFEAGFKANINVDQVLFSRSFLTMPIPGDTANTFDHIHVDTPDEHIVCLYYANDADGDTVFFDRTVHDMLEEQSVKAELAGKPTFYDQSLLELIDSKVNKQDFKIIKRVTPKKGRAVFFNGLRYHTAGRCTSGHRLIVNTCFRP